MSYLTNCKRALTIIMASIMLAVTVCAPASAATTLSVNGKTRVYTGRKSKVYFGGKQISTSKRYGLYINDNFMIPYKKLLVKTGPKMKASYSNKSKVLILKYNSKKVKVKANSKAIYVNDVKKSKLNTAPTIVKMEGSKVLVVPIKRIAAELGMGYSYNSSTRQIYLTKKKAVAATNTESANDKKDTQPQASATSTQNVAAAVTSIIQATSFKSLTSAAFIALLGPIAQADYHKTGVLASVTLAQAINESGWGRTELSQKGNNIFGMKISLSGNTWSGSVWDGKSYVSILTTEEYGGRKVKITAKFRKYNSVTESIADHSAYLCNAMNGSKRRYYGLTSTKNYAQQLKILQKGGYCTWSSYVSELTNLIKKYNLTKYDV